MKLKHYSLSYLIGESFKGLWRNGVMSFASIAVLMSLLVVVGGFTIIILTFNVNLEHLGLMNEIVVFCDTDLSAEDVDSVEQQILALDNIDEVTHVTKEEALQSMKDSSSAEYGEIYSELIGDENPLPDAFHITYNDNSKASTLYYQLGQIDGIAKVNNRLDVSVTIEKLKNGVTMVLTWFLIVLFIVSIFIIINTIKLSVYSRKNEIEIMRYIGASRWFITLPFIFEGIIIGIIAGGLGYLIEWFLYHYIETSLVTGFQMILFIPFSDVQLLMLAGFFGVGILTGVLGSSLSLHRYMKA